MELTTKESPQFPITMDIFLFFCNQEEQFQFLDYIDDLHGSTVLDKGTLDNEDKQECSIHGRGSHATHYVYLQLQKPNFGRITLGTEEVF